MMKYVVVMLVFLAFTGVIASPPEAEAAAADGSGLIISGLESLLHGIVWLVLVPLKAVGWVVNKLV